jgi:hypothetical protein
VPDRDRKALDHPISERFALSGATARDTVPGRRRETCDAAKLSQFRGQRA